ncbi:MAG: hypothetical protein HFJ55_07015 [Clostridia bacterium]|jgi:DNA mismatch repair ATPase MutS|nr:hypothetical protein [Clostridia bacterium]
MSKLVDVYNNLKRDDPDTIFLFKQGIFIIALSDDAKLLSEKFGFKLSNFNPDIVKCGFPYSSSEKYFNLFNEENLDIKVLDSSIIYNVSQYSLNKDIKKIFDTIRKIDINNLPVSQAYKIIEDLKEVAEKV